MKLKNLLVVFAASLLGAPAVAQGFGEQQNINKDWYFNLGDITYGGAESYDHSEWRKLDLPHDWSVEHNASQEYASCTGYLPGGIAWYRKDLDVKADSEGKKVYIYFGGVYNNSDVFINGKWIGKRPNGYISFMYDLTDYINFGGKNVVAVRVDHSDAFDSRWYTGSGIYRDVELIIADPVHIAQWGVSYESAVSGSTATVSVKTEIDNNLNAAAKVQVVNTLYSAEGVKVASAKGTATVAALAAGEVKTALKVKNPELWGIDSPTLYSMVTEVTYNGKVVDNSTVAVGIRTIDFDPNTGFTLNGESMKIKGICIHHDAGALGAAVPKEVWKRRLLVLKEIGVNAIRLAHNPHATYLYEICDEIGLMVKDEAFDEWEYPKKKWVTGWNQGEPSMQGSATYFREWCETDVKDMVRRDRNHPSIIMWSIGNEVDYPNDPYSHQILDAEGIGQKHEWGYQPNRPNADRIGEIAHVLAKAVRSIDSTRPVTGAMAGAVMSNETTFPDALDVIGYNYTEKRYAQDHADYPNRIYYGSETHHSMIAWNAVKDNEYISGQFIWTGYDFLGEAGAWPSRGSQAGMVNMAGYIKPQGFLRKTLWLDTPNAYFGTSVIREREPGRRGNPSTYASWNFEKGDKIRVVGMTNCEYGELYLNGKKVGDRKDYDRETGQMVWEVKYEPGVLEMRGYNGGEMATSFAIETTGHAAAIEASFEEEGVYKADQVLHLNITVVDDKGRLVNLADNNVTCIVRGDAKLLGLESGQMDVRDNYRDNNQRVLNGKLLGFIQTTGESGSFEVILSSPMLKSKVVKFTY
ncbi:MAG: glycoside hydrolase family 2 TIM barrel-domain containing protein [Rikenellaceae bacterium]